MTDNFPILAVTHLIDYKITIGNKLQCRILL